MVISIRVPNFTNPLNAKWCGAFMDFKTGGQFASRPPLRNVANIVMTAVFPALKRFIGAHQTGQIKLHIRIFSFIDWPRPFSGIRTLVTFDTGVMPERARNNLV